MLPCPVAPSQGRGSKPLAGLAAVLIPEVAPSQGRGSKHMFTPLGETGVPSPPHRGADRNGATTALAANTSRRPLTGARIETHSRGVGGKSIGVAPSQGRGSKRQHRPRYAPGPKSPPHRGADRNNSNPIWRSGSDGRPLTGARIETQWPPRGRPLPRVAPSQGRGSKHAFQQPVWRGIVSPPHRGADRNGRGVRL